jgi:hypothetical protein
VSVRFSPIAKSAVCPIVQTFAADVCVAMGLASPIALSDKDKLDALRRLDQFRQWPSLDEKRFCLVCSKIITGRQIEVAGGTRGNGPLRLSCPTERCHSIPIDWVLPTDEILASTETVTAEECNVSPVISAGPGVEHGLASRLLKFALHFKRAT